MLSHLEQTASSRWCFPPSPFYIYLGHLEWTTASAAAAAAEPSSSTLYTCVCRRHFCFFMPLLVARGGLVAEVLHAAAAVVPSSSRSSRHAHEGGVRRVVGVPRGCVRGGVRTPPAPFARSTRPSRSLIGGGGVAGCSNYSCPPCCARPPLAGQSPRANCDYSVKTPSPSIAAAACGSCGDADGPPGPESRCAGL